LTNEKARGRGESRYIVFSKVNQSSQIEKRYKKLNVTPHQTSVTYFRPRRDGLEAIIEDAVADQIPDLFPYRDELAWLGGSLPLGAGMPDLVLVSSRPEVFALNKVDVTGTQVLAHLRAVSRARAETIANRVGCRRKIIVRRLDALSKVGAVYKEGNGYLLAPVWREILSEIITIEARN
jgi:hypothetical protein